MYFITLKVFNVSMFFLCLYTCVRFRRLRFDPWLRPLNNCENIQFDHSRFRQHESLIIQLNFLC